MRLVAVVSTLLMLAMAAGCGGRARSGGAEPQPQLPDGRTFLSTEVTDGGKPRPLLDGTRIRLSFSDGELRVDAGCNTLLGQSKLADGRLVVGSLGGTEMGCPEPLMQQDQWLSEFLDADPRWKLEGDELTLIAGDVQVVLLDRVVADPDKPLRGTKWVLDTLIDGDTASSVPSGVTAYLKLSRARAGGDNGCNAFGGELTVHDDQLRVTDIVQTLKKCEGDAGQVEGAVLEVVNFRPLTYRIEADKLTLQTPSGKGLAFHAE